MVTLTIDYSRCGDSILYPLGPTKGSLEAAGYDMRASLVDPLTIEPGHTVSIPCGIAIALPKGTVGLFCSRSGLAAKHQVFVLNAPGVIDSDYRGELAAILTNAGELPYEVQPGERIGQLVIVPHFSGNFHWRETLSPTERGESGLGSTGRH